MTPTVIYPAASAFQNTGQGWWREGDHAATLRTSSGGLIATVLASAAHDGSAVTYDQRGHGDARTVPTIMAENTRHPSNIGSCIVYAADARNGTISDQETMTLTGGHKAGGTSLNTVPCIVEARQVGVWNGLGVGGGNYAPALTRNGAGDISNYSTLVAERDASTRWTMRRLTPLECIRLQGFDDAWLDGVTHRGKALSDAQIYKLAGNSWAVPVAAQIIERVVNHMLADDTAADVQAQELAA